VREVNIMERSKGIERGGRGERLPAWLDIAPHTFMIPIQQASRQVECTVHVPFEPSHHHRHPSITRATSTTPAVFQYHDGSVVTRYARERERAPSPSSTPRPSLPPEQSEVTSVPQQSETGKAERNKKSQTRDSSGSTRGFILSLLLLILCSR
jgi:hypothetical protein